MMDRLPRWRTPDEATTADGMRVTDAFMHAIRRLLAGLAAVGQVAGVLVVCPECRGPLAGASDGFPQRIVVTDLALPARSKERARVAILPLHCWLHRPMAEPGEGTS
jgi:hypothetical protein